MESKSSVRTLEVPTSRLTMNGLSDKLLERVTGFITRTSMANGGARIGVAVSGGADSVVLLHLLNQLRARCHFELAVVHVNHRLRGRESDLDEQFVRDLAGRLALPVFVESEAVPLGGNLEQAARDQRRNFFAQLRDEGLVNRIALGHTLSDQAETVLFRMMRGTGLTGLAGMLPLTPDGLIRPLLEVSRDEVRAYALELGLTWREDASNHQPEFRRNFIRLDLLPRLKEAFHDRVEQGLANLAYLVQAEEDFWGIEAKRVLAGLAWVLPDTGDGGGLLLESPRLMALHLAARRRVLRLAIERVKGDLKKVDSVHVDAILKLCKTEEGHDRVQVPGIDALRSFDRLRLTTPGKAAQTRHYVVDLALNQQITLPFQAGEIELRRSDSAAGIRANLREEIGLGLQLVDLDTKGLGLAEGATGLQVRNWEPGDEYRRFGHSHAEKVKTLFQEKRIYLWERRHWPVLELRGRIVWVKCFGAADEFAATRRSRATFRLSYYKEPLRGVES